MSLQQSVRRWLGGIVALHERSPAEREELRRLPASVRSYLIVSCLIDVYALTRLAPRDVPAVAALTVINALTILVPPIASPMGHVHIPRLAFTATIALLWPPLHAFIGVAFGILLAVFVFRLYEPWRAILNTVSSAYPAALASIAGHAVFRAIPDPLVGLTVASLAVVIVFWAMNYAALALAYHLRFGVSFFEYWWRSVTEDPVGQLLSAPLPIFLGAIAYGLGFGPLVLVALTAIAALMMPTERAQRTLYFASQRTTSDVVRALMLVLERTVPGAEAHAERVSALVAETGRRLRMSARTLEVWRQAGLLHDVGLIESQGLAAPPAAQAEAAARILASHPDPVVADIVRAHHTSWPRSPSKEGRTASLGASVLAAAERYDELRYGTADTPGLGTHAATVEALRPLIGADLDPAATAAVLETAQRLERKAAS